MTRIDFYLPRATGGLALTCRLVERALADRLRVLVHCADARQARELDRLLWTFREESFIPHGLVGATDPALTPVLIGTDGQPEAEDQVLINLAPMVPEFFSRFERLLEPVDPDPAARKAARARFAYYRDCGYPLQHHEVA